MNLQFARSLLRYFLNRSGTIDFVYRQKAWIRYYGRNFRQTKHPLDHSLIVSLTSYPPRFSTLRYTLQTLLSQSMQPDLVILWVHEPDYEHLPRDILSLVGRHFQIKTTDTNIRSFKKLIPALKLYPDAYIITADDDIYYPRRWIEDLVKAFKPESKEIPGHRGSCIGLTSDGQVRPYVEWKEISPSINVPNDRVFLTCGAGILYPPGSLHPEVVDERTFMSLCPTADDLWFYFMVRKNNYTYKIITERFRLYTWEGSQRNALYYENVECHQNDIYFKQLVQTYGLPFSQ